MIWANWFDRFCLWAKQTEYDIGSATGMNTRYLHQLKNEIAVIDHRIFLRNLTT